MLSLSFSVLALKTHFIIGFYYEVNQSFAPLVFHVPEFVLIYFAFFLFSLHKFLKPNQIGVNLIAFFLNRNSNDYDGF